MSRPVALSLSVNELSVLIVALRLYAHADDLCAKLTDLMAAEIDAEARRRAR